MCFSSPRTDRDPVARLQRPLDVRSRLRLNALPTRVHVPRHPTAAHVYVVR